MNTDTIFRIPTRIIGRPPAPPSFDKDGFCQLCRRKNGYCRCHDKIPESASAQPIWKAHDNTLGWFKNEFYWRLGT